MAFVAALVSMSGLSAANAGGAPAATSASPAGAPAAQAAVDIYITPGTHYVNGRYWRTTCGTYSSAITRCRTEIQSGGKWVFNNLTYKAVPRITWAGNNLGQTSEWTSAGRPWRTECDTAVTGYNGCRSYIRGSNGAWIFNNMVRFANDFYFDVSGVGDSVVALPTGVTEGLVVASHQGSSNFIVETLTAANADDQLLANVIGNYSGTTAFVDGGFSDPARKIQVQADGAWSIRLKPLSTAPKTTGTVSGRGDAVYWYTGGAATLRLTHTGESNFVVWALYADGDFDLLANEIGSSSGSHTIRSGPALLPITADGSWSISRIS